MIDNQIKENCNVTQLEIIQEEQTDLLHNVEDHLNESSDLVKKVDA
jgi:hypothetical protein